LTAVTLVLTLTGPAIFRRLWMPLLILVFAVPLPSFFNNALSLQLQLLSSALGVWVIRAAGTAELPSGSTVLVTLSGRGDKDVAVLMAEAPVTGAEL